MQVGGGGCGGQGVVIDQGVADREEAEGGN
jgi:hypothetical protein